MLKYTVKKYCAEGSKINQVAMAALIILPMFSYGTAVGWLSPMGPKLIADKSLDVSADDVSWMASVVYLVGMPAVFIFGYIVDNYGRKRALLLTSFSMALCWGLKLYSTATWALITARAIMGLGVSGSYVVTPLYIKEISEDSIRGTLGSLVVLSQNLGNLVVYIMGAYLSYYLVLWICLAVPLVHLLMFAPMPETPSYLLKVGKIEEARDALAWLLCRERSEAAVDSQLQLLILEREQENKCERFRDAIKTLVSDRSAFRAFRIVVTITLARELCGCLAVLHFASNIFDEASAGQTDWVLTPNQQAAVLGVVQLVGSCTASGLVERTGRKLRGTVTSLVMAFACALVSVELRVFQPLATLAGMYTVFWIFSGVCLISTVYIVICVPETRMRSLEEIYAEIGGKKRPKDCEPDVTRL